MSSPSGRSGSNRRPLDRRAARPSTPSGLTSALPAAAARRRALEQRAFAVLLAWGYREVIPPLLEFRDVIAPGLDPALLDRAYTVVDRHTGRLMVLRPDVTPQIARMAAQAAAHSPASPATGGSSVLRLCYRSTVFRHEDAHAGREREMIQIGGELIGWAGPEADAEPIAIAVETVRRAGLSRFKVALGHVGYLRGLFDACGVPVEVRREVESAMARRDREQMAQVLRRARVVAGMRSRLLATLSLIGGAEVLRRARRLLPARGGHHGRLALDRLGKVLTALQAAGLARDIVIDLGETRGFEYYTGVVFEIFAERESLGGGGRYDELVGQFGRPLPATGLALDIERLDRAVTATGVKGLATDSAALADRLDILLCLDETLPALARRLRDRGRRVATCPPLSPGGPRTPRSFQQLIRLARAHEADRVIIAGPAGRYTVVDARIGRRTVMTADALIESL